MNSELRKRVEDAKLASFYATLGWVMLRMVLNPSDIRPTFLLRDLTILKGFKLVTDKVKADPDSAAIIRDRFLAFTPHDIEALSKLPEGTLGHCHAKFMKYFAIPIVFYPDELGKQYQEGPISDETYLRMRARETHDVWHTVLGIPPDGFGEMEIATVYLRQMNLPLSGILLAVGFLVMTLQMPHGYAHLIESIHNGWSLGAKAKPLIGMRWEEMWHLPIADVRARLGIQVNAEAWDLITMDELGQQAAQRFDAYAAGREAPRHDARAKARFPATVEV